MNWDYDSIMTASDMDVLGVFEIIRMKIRDTYIAARDAPSDWQPDSNPTSPSFKIICAGGEVVWVHPLVVYLACEFIERAAAWKKSQHGDSPEARCVEVEFSKETVRAIMNIAYQVSTGRAPLDALPEWLHAIDFFGLRITGRPLREATQSRFATDEGPAPLNDMYEALVAHTDSTASARLIMNSFIDSIRCCCANGFYGRRLHVGHCHYTSPDVHAYIRGRLTESPETRWCERYLDIVWLLSRHEDTQYCIRELHRCLQDGVDRGAYPNIYEAHDAYNDAACNYMEAIAKAYKVWRYTKHSCAMTPEVRAEYSRYLKIACILRSMRKPHAIFGPLDTVDDEDDYFNTDTEPCCPAYEDMRNTIKPLVRNYCAVNCQFASDQHTRGQPSSAD